MSFIHPKSDVDATASLGKNVYIAAFACIHADEGSIEVGDSTSIQETCVIHGKNVRIGKNVTVGHGAIVHGCKVADNVLIGMNATLLNGCEIGEWSIVAAGAVVTEGMRVPPGSIVAGVPAKILRSVADADKKLIADSCENYLQKLRKMGKFEG
ncbi:MAG: gamma carbonic anhydrase family protein [Candidatus Micrarchaeia archaeon]|jgi:carbonic anhydrase/acetyltransferase-like protein (isoleucine patch superfamily)